MNILQILLLCFNFSLIFGANILIFSPIPFSSHIRGFSPLFKELATRGHNVTFYTVTPLKETVPNLKQIIVKDVITDYIQDQIVNHKDTVAGWKYIPALWELGIFSTKTLFQEPQIQEVLQSTDLSFDLILLETFFVHEPFVILGHKFNAPVVNLHPIRAEEWISDILRNPQPLSYIPNFRLPITERMTFYERTLNTIFSVYQSLTGHYYYLPTVERIMKKYVKYPGSEDLPPLLELLKNTSLTLLNGNPTVLYPSPSVPNFISIGGIHISPNKKLPNDLEKYINESTHGIVFLSLGSHLRLSGLPPKILNAIIKVLGSLPQRVLVKWEADEKMPGQPSNILTSKWFPQMDILAHPKCRAFISHGGFHSVVEAGYFGVPIVGVPVIIDQESNLLLAQSKGFAEVLKFENLNAEVLSSALDKVLNNPRYKKNAKTISRIIKDVPMTPLESAVFWVEHVLRHKGAKHLQVAGTHLPWYQYYLLDIIFVAFLIVLLTFFSLHKLIKIILILIYGNGKKKFVSGNKSSKNKKD